MINHFFPLTRALRLDRFEGKPMVAIVGGGGKTTTMFMLASEFAAQGKRVVTTTTTRLFASQRAESPAWCAMDEVELLGGLLDEHGQCLVTAADSTWADGKARGITPEQVAALAARADVDAVLIEADGSRKRPFKAPASYEPVIPVETTHVVPVVGADVFGLPLTAKYVHRPERIMALSGAAEGVPVTANIVASILTHPDGGLRNVPDGAAFVPFINKVEEEPRVGYGEETAQLLLRHERIDEVLLGSLHELKRSGPEERLKSLLRVSRSAGVVLAAGMASRFGKTKQLLLWEGKPLVAHVAEVALAVCDRVLVIVGHEGERVANAVAHLPVEVVVNERFALGQGTSVAAGAAALVEQSKQFERSRSAAFIGEAFFMLADQPLVTPGLLEQLRMSRGLRGIAVPRYEGKRGNPVLFDASLLPKLCDARGDVGGRALFEQYRDEIAWLDVEDAAVLRDVDTPEDWERLSKRWSRRLA